MHNLSDKTKVPTQTNNEHLFSFAVSHRFYFSAYGLHTLTAYKTQKLPFGDLNLEFFSACLLATSNRLRIYNWCLRLFAVICFLLISGNSLSVPIVPIHIMRDVVVDSPICHAHDFHFVKRFFFIFYVRVFVFVIAYSFELKGR